MDLSTGTHVIRFTASWCGPCKVYAPVFEAVTSSKPDISTHVVDIDNDPLNLVGKYAVRSVPTTVIVQDGQPVKVITGVTPASSLHTSIDNTIS